MAKFWLDTEFHEYSKQPTVCGLKVGKPIDTIELISIGIVSDNYKDIDNSPGGLKYGGGFIKQKEYYAICKEFDLKAAWNNEWLRENVLYSIFKELWGKLHNPEPERFFTYKTMKMVLNKFGKTRKQIAEEVRDFVYLKDERSSIRTRMSKNECSIKASIGDKLIEIKPEFYAYYADYDHVCLSWLYGRMIDLPKGFPQYTKDIQQMIDDNNINKELLLKEVPQINCHNSLQDAIWNKKAYNWIIKQLQ